MNSPSSSHNTSLSSSHLSSWSSSSSLTMSSSSSSSYVSSSSTLRTTASGSSLARGSSATPSCLALLANNYISTFWLYLRDPRRRLYGPPYLPAHLRRQQPLTSPQQPRAVSQPPLLKFPLSRAQFYDNLRDSYLAHHTAHNLRWWSIIIPIQQP